MAGRVRGSSLGKEKGGELRASHLENHDCPPSCVIFLYSSLFTATAAHTMFLAGDVVRKSCMGELYRCRVTLSKHAQPIR